jgi:hypothetical protein
VAHTTTMPAASRATAVGTTDAPHGRLETALILLIGAWFLIPRTIQTLKIAKGVHTAVGAQASYTGLASAAQRGLFYLTAMLPRLGSFERMVRLAETRLGDRLWMRLPQRTQLAGAITSSK